MTHIATMYILPPTNQVFEAVYSARSRTNTKPLLGPHLIPFLCYNGRKVSLRIIDLVVLLRPSEGNQPIIASCSIKGRARRRCQAVCNVHPKPILAASGLLAWLCAMLLVLSTVLTGPVKRVPAMLAKVLGKDGNESVE